MPRASRILCIYSSPNPATAMVADVLKELKRSSSVWLKTKSRELADFAWQNGYGVFSIGQWQGDAVRAYIAGQEEHHHKVSFQDEFRRLLQRYKIEFDERYVWNWFNPFRVDACGRIRSQGSPQRATLGWMIQSRWDWLTRAFP